MRIGEQGLNAIQISVIDISDEIEMKLFNSAPEKLNFKFRMENQNRLFSIDSFLTKKDESDEVFKFKLSMISAEDTAELNYRTFQQLSEESSLNPMLVELFKVVKTCLDPFMVGAAQGIYLFAEGRIENRILALELIFFSSLFMSHQSKCPQAFSVYQ